MISHFLCLTLAVAAVVQQRQRVLGALGGGDAFGLTTEQWVQDRLGGYVRLSVVERREAVKELTAAREDGGEGLSTREAAAVLGVHHDTVAQDKHAVGFPAAVGAVPQGADHATVGNPTVAGAVPEEPAPTAESCDSVAAAVPDANDEPMPDRSEDTAASSVAAPAEAPTRRQARLARVRGNVLQPLQCQVPVLQPRGFRTEPGRFGLQQVLAGTCRCNRG